MKNRTKKLFGMIMGGMMAVSLLTACGSEETGSNTNGSYEIVWHYPVLEQAKDLQEVQTAINEYIEPKIGAVVKLEPFDWGTYEQKMNNIAAAQEKYDLCFSANYLFNYASNVDKGAFADITEYVKNKKGITDVVSIDNLLTLGNKKEGQIFGIPVVKDFAYNYGFIIRKDLAEKYKLDPATIKGYDDLIPYLDQVKANEPDVIPLRLARGASPASLIPFENIAFPIVMRIDKNIGVAENIVEDEDYQNAYRESRKLYLAGYTKAPNVAGNSDYTKLIKEGRLFCTLERCKPGKAEELSSEQYPYIQIDITEPIKDIGCMQGAVMCVSQTSDNPEKVVDFIELLYTDKTLNNLLVYGIEGKHYTKINDEVVQPVENSGYNYSTSKWMFGNTYLHYLLPNESPDKNEKMKEFNETAIVSPYIDIAWDRDALDAAIKTENVSCANTREEYETNLEEGTIDPDTVLPEYINKLRQIGSEKMKAAVQEAYNKARN